MNDFFRLMILGVLQGLTEFLPVSSSGHLVIAGALLEVKDHGPLLEVVLHGGTLLATLAYYRARIIDLVRGAVSRNPSSLSYIGAVLLGCIPAVLVYAMAGQFIESRFDSPLFAAAMLCVTGVVLLSTLIGGVDGSAISGGKGFIVGCAQAVALPSSSATSATARRLPPPVTVQVRPSRPISLPISFHRRQE